MTKNRWMLIAVLMAFAVGLAFFDFANGGRVFGDVVQFFGM